MLDLFGLIIECQSHMQFVYPVYGYIASVEIITPF